MPSYRVTIINEHFSQEGEQEAPDHIKAWHGPSRARSRLQGNRFSHGNPFFGAEVRVEQGNKQIGRYVVALGATPLKD